MIPDSLVYSGTYNLEDPIEVSPGVQIPIGKLILSPTRTYLPVMKEILSHYRKELHGVIHCSGGGQTKVLHFINQLHIIKDNLLPTPPLFLAIQKTSGTKWPEMYKVFNMGHRLEIYTSPEVAEKLIQISLKFNIHAQVIGRVEKLSPSSPSEDKKLTIKSPFGEFVYPPAAQ
eukprot:TRINITY_DN8817_c0_g1_i1.p2 TRINITY_DN8817_c0_g1~~TRINITY_DN8817_c0_g1_i1.p2  ORF type:complete len:173 (-),score=37.19 TRINITY_DN8817_c0_g1_i1:26-544(-)